MKLGTQINLLDFEVERSEVKVTARPQGQISILGGTVSRVSGMHGRRPI